MYFAIIQYICNMINEIRPHDSLQCWKRRILRFRLRKVFYWFFPQDITQLPITTPPPRLFLPTLQRFLPSKNSPGPSDEGSATTSPSLPVCLRGDKLHRIEVKWSGRNRYRYRYQFRWIYWFVGEGKRKMRVEVGREMELHAVKILKTGYP